MAIAHNLPPVATTPAIVVLEPTCCDYLLEKVQGIWQAVYAWIVALFSTPASIATPIPVVQPNKVYPTFRNLPLPLLGRIVNFNDAKSNALFVACVSPSFYQVYKKWLHEVRPEMHGQGSHEFVAFYERAVSHQDTPECLQKLLQSLKLAPLDIAKFKTKISRLEISGGVWFFRYTDQWQLFAYPFPALQDLTLELDNLTGHLHNRSLFIQSVVKSCPEVRKLQMTNLMDSEMHALISGLPKLEEITMHTQDAYLIATRDALSKHPKIKRVERSYSFNTGVFGVQNIPHVKSLKLKNEQKHADFEAMDSSAVKYLHQKAKVPLERLELIRCGRIVDDSELLHFPQLRTLVISECSRIGKAAFQGAKLPELRELTLYASRLNDVLEQISTWPKLEVLSLDSCIGYSRDTLSLLAQCKGLRVFKWQSIALTVPFADPFIDLSRPLAHCKLLEKVELSRVAFDEVSGTQDFLDFTSKLPNLREIDVAKSFGFVSKDSVRRAAEKRAVPFHYWLPAKEKA